MLDQLHELLPARDAENLVGDADLRGTIEVAELADDFGEQRRGAGNLRLEGVVRVAEAGVMQVRPVRLCMTPIGCSSQASHGFNDRH